MIKLVAIDHSYSLGHASHGNPLAIPAGIGYGSAHDHAAPDVRHDVVHKIQAMDFGTIVSIVRRLDVILTAEEQDAILSLLNARRQALPALLAN